MHFGNKKRKTNRTYYVPDENLKHAPMLSTNSTARYSPSLEVISICRSLGRLNDPSKATSTSLGASLSSIITTALTFPFAAFLNALVLVAFYKNTALRKQANVFLMALALTDFIRAVLASPLLIIKDVYYQKQLEPSCLLTVFLWNISLFTQGELLLTAINCERFIGLRYPIWHRVHVTKPLLVKVAVACCCLGVCLTLVRSFTEKAQTLVVLLFACSYIITFTFAVLIWRDIKKRNVQICPQPVEATQTAAESSSHSNKQNQTALQVYQEEKVLPGEATQTAAESSTRPNKQNQSALQVYQKDNVLRLNLPFHREVNASHFSSSKQKLTIQKKQIHTVKKDPDEEAGFQGHNNQKDTVGHICRRSISEIDSAKTIQKEANLSTDGNNSTQQQRTISRIQPIPHLSQQAGSNAILTKSERKAAILATYLAIGLLFTRFLPFVSLAFVSVQVELMYVLAPFMQAVRLLTSLVEPVIFIATNEDIRKACFKLVKC